MPPQDARRRMRSGAVQLSAVTMLSLSLVACSSSTRAYCVDGWSSSAFGRKVVPDHYCDNGGSFGRYYWYYGGRYHGGYISRGSTIRPRGSRITTRGGRVISRGGFGGHFGGHSGSHGG
jgi:hypothetical protein